MVAPLFDENGVLKGETELPGVFDGEIREDVVHAAVVAILANARIGSASVKGRGQVSGGGTKPWRQKGTGRARAGSIRSPLWRGGGIVFGPTPRSYRQDLPKRVRRLALLSALRAKAKDGRVLAIEGIRLETYKTKRMVDLLRQMGIVPGEKCLILLEKRDDVVQRSLRNIQGISVALVNQLNIMNVLRCDKLIAVQSALSRFEETATWA